MTVFDIVDSFILSAGTQTLSYNSHKTYSYSDSGNTIKFSRILVMAWAAMATVPRVDTVDWIASFPNWNMLFSIPDGIPMSRIF